MKLEEINNIQDIKSISNNSDGENLYFELKSGKKLDRQTKKLLSKEICAFANTYGGIVCFHYGEDKKIVGFPQNEINEQFIKVESWTRDCLEPKISGIEIKQTSDNVILIKVPESKIKPHRSQMESIYYYRHSTISQIMPEIMISSLYKAKDYLEFEIKPSIDGKLTKTNGYFVLDICLKNLSNTSGNRPKIQFQIFSNINKTIPIKKIVNINDKGGESYDTDYQLNEINYNSNYTSNKSFSDNILYPKDSLHLICISDESPTIREIDYIFLRIDCMFMETQRKTEYFLFKYNLNNFNLIHSSKNMKKEEVIQKAIKFIK